MDKSEIVGWWWPFDVDLEEGSGATVGDSMQNLPHSMIISSGGSFYEIADAFARRSHPFYFVLDCAEITGTVSYLDLFSRTGQLCLLSLTFFLEAVAEELCVLRAEQCWKTLSAKRQQLAEEVLVRRFDRFRWVRELPPDHRWPYLIRSTTFIDKGTMLAGGGFIATFTKSVIKSVVARAERVRNLCAHGASEQELSSALPRSDFAAFLHRTQDLIEEIRLKAIEFERD